MSCRFLGCPVQSWLVPWAVLLTVGPAAVASDLPFGHLCCPVNKRCQEKPPCWHIKRVCPKPICDPCTLEHHGYYHTCWRPSSVPPEWSHCPVPPPAVHFLQSQVPPPGPVPGFAPAAPLQPAPTLPGARPLPQGQAPASSQPTGAVLPPPALIAPTSTAMPAITPPPLVAPAAPTGKPAAYLPASL